MQRTRTLAGAVAVAVAVAGIALVVGASGGAAVGGDAIGSSSTNDLPASCTKTKGTKARIAEAKLLIEYNSTDDDIGVHGAFDDHGWKALCVFDPTGRPVLVVGPRGRLVDLTMAGIFFESREPPASEFSLADLRATFPEGEYSVRAESFDGTILTGAATFTHDVPAPPTITSPALAEDPKGTDENPVAPDGLTVEWDAVTETVDGGPLAVTGYQVIVTKELADDPHGFSRPIYDVHVPPTVQRLPVPAEFLQPDTVYEVEVLALEESGNQTISVGFFRTA